MMHKYFFFSIFHFCNSDEKELEEEWFVVFWNLGLEPWNCNLLHLIAFFNIKNVSLLHSSLPSFVAKKKIINKKWVANCGPLWKALEFLSCLFHVPMINQSWKIT